MMRTLVLGLGSEMSRLMRVVDSHRSYLKVAEVVQEEVVNCFGKDCYGVHFVCVWVVSVEDLMVFHVASAEITYSGSSSSWNAADCSHSG